ncbi:MAG: hypothetical protein WC162_04985 [Sphaerochaetaceae bacterium]|nr:hypothetical protein [Sphaerochaetaceae bacterium]
MNYCPNPKCICHTQKGIDYYGKNNWYKKHGFYETSQYKKIRRYRCKFCGKTFSERKNTDSWYFHRDDIDSHKMLNKWCEGKTLQQLANSNHCSITMIRTRISRVLSKDSNFV